MYMDTLDDVKHFSDDWSVSYMRMRIDMCMKGSMMRTAEIELKRKNELRREKRGQREREKK